MQFYSQSGADRYLFENFFYGKRDGVFLDIGAADGETFSNSLFFERSMGWAGLCTEPRAAEFAKLAATRKAVCAHLSGAEHEGDGSSEGLAGQLKDVLLRGLRGPFGWREPNSAAAVDTPSDGGRPTKLSALLARHHFGRIDYCCIQEDGVLPDVLAFLESHPVAIVSIRVEPDGDDNQRHRLLTERGYAFVIRLGQDEIFKRREIRPLPKTSVFCAVWHGDPRRIELLRAHQANLARQTVPIAPIYVFDGGDEVPAWLEGQAVSVREPLTIYQAWNVALSLAGTPFAMNLNLDDRLAPDAVEHLETALLRHDAALAAGDWNICYTQTDTDQVEPCYSVDRLPFVTDWPPPPGTRTRLGSGTGQRKTFGPATLWRMSAHVGAPRYPWRLSDGTALRCAGDAAWWTLLRGHLKAQMVRVPLVIGNYHSHPADQAEFRVLPHDEIHLLNTLGVSLL